MPDAGGWSLVTGFHATKPMGGRGGGGGGSRAESVAATITGRAPSA